MYSLDINFLNDRQIRQEAATPGRVNVSPDNKTPLYIGAAVAVLAPLIAGLAWFLLNNSNASLTQKQAELDTKLTEIKAKLGEIDVLRKQIKDTTDETAALASVFTRIKPWSAMAQDIRDRIPAGIQIATIEQIPPPATSTPVPSASPSPGAQPPPAPPPIVVLKLAGIANNFDAVNDFLLVLQKSSFFKPEETKLVKATLGKPRTLQSLSLEGSSGGDSSKTPKLPPVVEFEIQTSLTEVSTSDLIREVERKGAVGLVTRIEYLQQKGVIPPTQGTTAPTQGTATPPAQGKTKP
ncbi:MAG: PilN domain-containing protein [Scytolyngbya sp. HA4215-MV1]|jgi:type IV pilus assembly protein PilN|nr:PilN domain-containing protein [Scytolyngbya sp. HA4215-MV1]